MFELIIGGFVSVILTFIISIIFPHGFYNISKKINRFFATIFLGDNPTVSCQQSLDLNDVEELTEINEHFKNNRLYKYNYISGEKFEIKDLNRQTVIHTIVIIPQEEDEALIESIIINSKKEHPHKVKGDILDVYDASRDLREYMIGQFGGQLRNSQFQIYFGRSIETKYFLDSIKVESAKGKTEKGYVITVKEKSIEFVGQFGEDAKKEIITLSRLA